MNKTILLPLLVIGLFCLFFSCHPSKENILYEKTFEEVKQLAKKKKKPFCILLSEPDCEYCSTHIKNLVERFPDLAEQYVFNIVDVSLPENKWYQQWLWNTTLPVTCIFDKKGNLSAVLPGSGVQILECAKSIVEDEKSCAEQYRNKLKPGLEYEETIELLGKTQQYYFDVLKGKNIDVQIDTVLSRKQTPFGLYMKLLNEQMYGTVENSKTLAYQLLSYSYEVENIRLYKELFLHCKKIIDPGFNEENEPVLSVKENPVRLNNCVALQPVPFPITLKNEGNTTLDIYDIQLPCACLYFSGDKEFSLNPGEEITLTFTFMPNVKGIVEREIMIVSNALEDIVTIQIIAETI